MIGQIARGLLECAACIVPRRWVNAGQRLQAGPWQTARRPRQIVRRLPAHALCVCRRCLLRQGGKHLGESVVTGRAHDSIHFLTVFDEHKARYRPNAELPRQFGALVNVHLTHRIAGIVQSLHGWRHVAAGDAPIGREIEQYGIATTGERSGNQERLK